MVEFKPDIKDNIVIYNAFENGRQTGKATLTINKNRCYLNFIEAIDNETAEGLIRSALNAAANRDAYVCEYLADSFVSVATLLGFKGNDGKLYGEIPFLLSGCCGCENKCQ